MEIIVEVAQAHDGSLGMCHSYIDALAEIGVDTVKFQTHIAEAESSEEEPFRVKFSRQDVTRQEYWKRMSFTVEQWQGLKDHCDEVGLKFLSTPFSCAAVDLLEKIGVERYKIGSGDLTNELLLKKVALTKKPIIISTGMASFDEINKAVKLIKVENIKLSLMQCTSSYPVPLEEVGVNVLKEFKKEFSIDVGLSDHSGTVFPSVYCAAHGVDLIEVHVAFSKKMFGPDTRSSLDLDQIKEIVQMNTAFNTLRSSEVVKVKDSRFAEMKRIFGRSLALNCNKVKGEMIRLSDLESKKPAGLGLPCENIETIIGRKLNKNLNKWDFITEEDLDG
ncbi:N-acetylneuraminate synthase family protein [Marinomonas sp. PE14-40]|uniref:N-acetylneuraminate synthase family protein n=1 Tax=Marinomonas sp. PE14-40 TaxID=3060621 RepID=UPI003F66D13F